MSRVLVAFVVDPPTTSSKGRRPSPALSRCAWDVVVQFGDDAGLGRLFPGTGSEDGAVPAGGAPAGRPVRPVPANPDRHSWLLHRVGRVITSSMVTCWPWKVTGSPDHSSVMASRPSSSRLAKTLGSLGSPKRPYSLSIGSPRPPRGSCGRLRAGPGWRSRGRAGVVVAATPA
jgi:hypothetical protein